MQDGGRAKGEIYISPEYDNFILLQCHDQAEPDAVERKALTWGYKGTLDPSDGVVSRYVLAELPIAIPKRVGTLTLAAKRSPSALFFACDFSTVCIYVLVYTYVMVLDRWGDLLGSSCFYVLIY